MSLMLYENTIWFNLGVFTNPGAVPHNAWPLEQKVEENDNLLIRCGICDAYKPAKSHHCR